MKSVESVGCLRCGAEKELPYLCCFQCEAEMECETTEEYMSEQLINWIKAGETENLKKLLIRYGIVKKLEPEDNVRRCQHCGIYS